MPYSSAKLQLDRQYQMADQEMIRLFIYAVIEPRFQIGRSGDYALCNTGLEKTYPAGESGVAAERSFCIQTQSGQDARRKPIINILIDINILFLTRLQVIARLESDAKLRFTLGGCLGAKKAEQQSGKENYFHVN